jgi:hypothetical protein
MISSESLADINIAHEENDEGTQGHRHHRGRPRARKTFTNSGQQTISAQPDCDGMNKRNSSKKETWKKRCKRKKTARKKGVVQSNNGVDDSKEATISSENPICPEKDIATIEASSDPTLKSVSTKTRKDKTKVGNNENKNRWKWSC